MRLPALRCPWTPLKPQGLCTPLLSESGQPDVQGPGPFWSPNMHLWDIFFIPIFFLDKIFLPVIPSSSAVIWSSSMSRRQESPIQENCASPTSLPSPTRPPSTAPFSLQSHHPTKSFVTLVHLYPCSPRSQGISSLSIPPRGIILVCAVTLGYITQNLNPGFPGQNPDTTFPSTMPQQNHRAVAKPPVFVETV